MRQSLVALLLVNDSAKLSGRLAFSMTDGPDKRRLPPFFDSNSGKVFFVFHQGGLLFLDRSVLDAVCCSSRSLQ